MYLCVQVRCYFGDNEQRWMMWYSGHSREPSPLDSVYPAAGSIGVHLLLHCAAFTNLAAFEDTSLAALTTC